MRKQLKGVILAKQPFEELRERMIKKAKEGIRSAYTNEEYALIQAINAYLETNKSYNLAFERLSEWYGLYFPEIKIGNARTLAELVGVLNSRSDISKDKILSVLKDEQKSAEIYNKAVSTIGREMNDNESKAVLEFARMAIQMYDTMDGLESYIKAASNALMPNATYLTDEKIAAELLSKAGSLERLASMPASTIQLLGAEKSLFKHIKFGSKPPKYGILFKLPEISTGQREKRGRIARAYATKITIALKADFYTKNFIAKKLKTDLEGTIKKIKESPNKKGPTKQTRFSGKVPDRGKFQKRGFRKQR